jgi:hypothetical protein
MSNSTRRFVVLSQSVNTSDDVFNSLVEVQDKETGEKGLLLCSHMCNWPEELINQANWLEGCKTPELYKDEPRLALGYHPEQYTQWKVFKETNEIEIYLTGCWNQQDNEDNQFDYEDQWLCINLPYNSVYYTNIRRTRQNGRRDRVQMALESFKPSLVRFCKRVLTSDITQESLNNFESLIHRLFNSGRIDCWQACVLPSLLLENEPIHWEGSNDLFMPQGINPYMDGGIYSEDYMVIPYKRSSEGITVLHTIPEEGFYKAIDFDFSYSPDGVIVHYCNPLEVYIEDDYLIEDE